MAKSKVPVIVALLKELDIVRQHRSQGISLIRRDLVEADLQHITESYVARGERDRDKLERVIIYAQTALCRWKHLTDYFDDSLSGQQCGHCDNCTRASAATGPARSGTTSPESSPAR